MIHGFLRAAAASPECTVADSGANTAEIVKLIQEAAEKGCELAIFPELCVTGYTCGDLFAQELSEKVSLAAVRHIAEKTRDFPVVSVVGFPFAYKNARYNCAAVITGGKIAGIVPKTHIPDYGEFYEMRHFQPGPAQAEILPAGIFGQEGIPFGTNILFQDEKNPAVSFAVEICEDLWVPDSPSQSHVLAGALLVANLSASNEIIGKAAYRRQLVSGISARGVCGYIYADAGLGESSTDMVFSGHNLLAENGVILAESGPFSGGLLCGDIDTARLIQERRRMNTFAQRPGNPAYTAVPLRLCRSPAELCAPAQSADAARESSVIYAGDGRPEVPASSSENALKIRDGHTAWHLLRRISAYPFIPENEQERNARCAEILAIQSSGLAKRLSHTGCSCAVIGLSGGLDSTLALLVTVRAFDFLGLPRSGIQCLTMPGFGTTETTRHNASALADILGVPLQEIRIHEAVQQHFADIGHNPHTLDATYENAQARERTQILMDTANQNGGIVIGTGDLSELALGWATYNGDHMSMYAVNASVPKTLVRFLVAYCVHNPGIFVQDKAGTRNESGETQEQRIFAGILNSVLDTPVSPELLPPENGAIAQKTENLVGPYELHDFFLYYAMRWGFAPSKILYLAEEAFIRQKSGTGRRYSRAEILHWMQVFYRRFFSQQFKRSCLPDGPKVGSVSLSPRSDWRMPSDASAALWLKELEKLETDPPSAAE